jgi:hypothetical protein
MCSRKTRGGVRIAGLLAALSGASGAACAPAASFRPASALRPGQTDEVGLGLAVVGPRPYVDEPSASVGEAWATHALAPQVRLSLVSAFDADALGAGFVLTLLPVQTPRVAAGVEFELGFAWAGVALPVAVRTVGQTWVYASPRLGSWGDRVAPAIPFGVDVHLLDTVSARAECQVSWASFEPNNRRVHYGVALAYQFGESSK